MFGIFKNKKEHPAFDTLNNFNKKDFYFIRVTPWDWLNKEIITVFDPHNSRVFTLDAWPQYIFIAANGQMTVQEYVYYMADKYKGKIPDELDQTIIDELLTLIDYRVIEFSDHKQRPKPEFELPKREK